MTACPAGELAARRHMEGNRAVIVITLDDVELGRLGGKRAERAEAALVTGAWPGDPADEVRIWGLRGDHARAAGEAAAMVRKTEIRTRPRFGGRGAVIPCNAPAWAVAVPVVA